MAIVNRKSGIVSGKVGGEVFCRWHGEQTVRKVQSPYIARNSADWREAKCRVVIFNKVWIALPADVKMQWDQFAAAQGCASDVETSRNVSYRHNPISNYPPRPKLLSGRMAFIGANCKRIFAGWRRRDTFRHSVSTRRHSPD